MYVCKAALICNKCGAKRETSSLGYDPFALSGAESGPREDGWISPRKETHLCPDCAKPYLERKEEMERELKKLAGIETIEFDI